MNGGTNGRDAARFEGLPAMGCAPTSTCAVGGLELASLVSA